jgi:hypothetical protein
MPADETPRPFLDLNALTATLIAALRADGHLCNVLTHIGRGDWRLIESALQIIVAPRTSAEHLDPVARNVLELICDGRGVTGPVMKNAVYGSISRSADARQVRRLKARIMRLRRAVRAADRAVKAGPVATGAIEAAPSALPKQAHSVVAFERDSICVDAADIADGLGLDPASVPPGMQRGEIKAICERGIGADDGLYRLTFLRSRYRVQLIVANDGSVRKRSIFLAENENGSLRRSA